MLDVEPAGLTTERPTIALHPRRRRPPSSPASSWPAATASTGSAGRSIPARCLSEFAREYPFAWLGVLAKVAPSTDELIYAFHDRGFALHSLRSPELSRLYLQVRPD